MTPSACTVTPGFPIRTSQDQRSFDSSSGLIAAYHVLHRLITPRHPPYTLSSLVTFAVGPRGRTDGFETKPPKTLRFGEPRNRKIVNKNISFVATIHMQFSKSFSNSGADPIGPSRFPESWDSCFPSYDSGSQVIQKVISFHQAFYADYCKKTFSIRRTAISACNNKPK